MSEIRFISGEAALRQFLDGFDQQAKGELERRNINASGALSKSHRVEVFTSSTATTGEVLGLSYWTKAGSGSPPGTVASLEGLKGWLLDKGIVKGNEPTEWIAALIQDKIYEQGSRDFRERNPNVYRETAKAVEDGVPDVVSAFLKDLTSPIGKAFTAAFKVA